MPGWILDDPAFVGHMFKATGGCEVSFGGVTTHGHFEDDPDELFDQAPLVAFKAAIVIPTRSLPDIGPELPSGHVKGKGEKVLVDGEHYEGPLEWTIVGFFRARTAGEIGLLLGNE